jgi:hypothetical protein
MADRKEKMWTDTCKARKVRQAGRERVAKKKKKE